MCSSSSSMAAALALAAVASVAMVAPVAADCELEPGWAGRWFHSGFPEPLNINRNSISGKGKCVKRGEGNNMFLIQDSGSSGYASCFRCMMIYEKHVNVLQYKESYCEENISSMEALCNTIAGDAPLYTMFRKEASLVKCPFKGPFSFSYSKGGRGQVCGYPQSYMDTCADNKRMVLRYQACLDVEGSEAGKEEMSCLASWKEGSSRYLVAMMNHSHVYTDEARYRCFVFQRQRDVAPMPMSLQSGHHGADSMSADADAVFKMAQSNQASCLGLWSVDEGYRTFTLRKLEEDDKQCHFPSWLGRHEWGSVDGAASIHINKKGHSLRMTNRQAQSHHGAGSGFGGGAEGAEHPVEAHVTCHSAEEEVESGVARVVAHVKAGCDSGYVCMVFYSRDKHVIQMRMGSQSRDPSEACLDYHFDAAHSPALTLVSRAHAPAACPFNGMYSLDGHAAALFPLLENMSITSSEAQNCHKLQVTMQAGCAADAAGANDLQVEATCHSVPGPIYEYQRSSLRSGRFSFGGDGPVNDQPVSVRSGFACHGKWRDDAGRNVLMVSTGTQLMEDNSFSRNYLCLSYTEQDGVLLATADRESCGMTAAAPARAVFNITSSGPCLQALTGGSSAVATTAPRQSTVLVGAAVTLMTALRMAGSC